jgi:hypothetical protein
MAERDGDYCKKRSRKMGFSTSSMVILTALIGLGAVILRAVRAARQRVEPVKILVRVEPTRRQKGRKYE